MVSKKHNKFYLRSQQWLTHGVVVVDREIMPKYSTAFTATDTNYLLRCNWILQSFHLHTLSTPVPVALCYFCLPLQKNEIKLMELVITVVLRREIRNKNQGVSWSGSVCIDFIGAPGHGRVCNDKISTVPLHTSLFTTSSIFHFFRFI